MTVHQLRRGRLAPRMLAFLVLIAVIGSAGLAGAAVDRLLVRAREQHASTLPDTGYHPLSSVLRSPTDAQRRAAREQLARQLSLTPGQVPIVDSILDSHAAAFRVLREEIRPRVEMLTSAVRADVEHVLTDTQRERYRALLGGTSTSDSMRASK